MSRTITEELQGRARALETLDSVLAAAAAGTGGCVVVEGPAGIGKTSLLAAALRRAADEDLTVAHRTAAEADQWAPFTTLLSALAGVHELKPHIADLVAARGAPLLQVARLEELLENYSAVRPLVVVVDDAHWADELSSWALRALVPALASSQVLWVLARRTSPARRPAQDAISWLLERGAHRLPLEPLDDRAVARLCADLLGARPARPLVDQALRSGGNPFLVKELVARLVHEGLVHIDGGVAQLSVNRLPSGFLQAVSRRLGDLSDDARRLLEAGAVLGRAFTLHEAAGLLGCEALELAPATTEAIESGDLVDLGAELVLRHDLIREAVYGALPGPVRLALHRVAATVLQAEGCSPLEVADHLLRSRRVGDPQGQQILREAIERVATTAPGTAADLALRWMALTGKAQPPCPALGALVVRLLAAAGRVDEARTVGESALRLGLDGATEAGLRLGLCQALKHAGDDRGVTEHARQALRRSGVPDELRAQLMAVHAHALLSGEDFAEAEDIGARAAELGRARLHFPAVVFATVARSGVARTRGDTGRALELAREAVELADSRGGGCLSWHPRLWLGRALIAADRMTEAQAVLEVGQRQADQLGSAWSQPLWHYYRAELHMAVGRVDDAEAEAEAGVRIAEQLNVLALDVPLLAVLGQVAFNRGDVELSRDYVERAEALVAKGVGAPPGMLAWRRALVQEACGDTAGLARSVREVCRDLPQRLSLLVQEPRAAARLVRMARAVGDPASAAVAVAAVGGLAERNPDVASYRAAAWHARGLQQGDLATLRRAVAEYAPTPRALDRAAALEDAARAAQVAGCGSEATLLLAGADQLLGSGPRRRLLQPRPVASRGALPGPRAVEAPNVVAGGVLTESEVRVVRLVAEGLTNREVATRLYLSPHTVDSHLRHTFTKLGIRSRVQLAREVARRPELLQIP
ncbi:LuxR family transcriptional regulator [Blastococcus sp. KM273128]|uniref:helix-turn-helix transcriptional regulator n=1 Tax=Blastococcus sp. KM273128 TaxID=2570314 RepID=UPI002714FA49|nr:LuxR family transcriptional regulator [Blastococcus sp. KM273128]MCF6744046.1 LuxR family transcriptional regulator [Blastococcus sp. KM273128]